MTYMGSMTNVLTLAHELGHAFHNWVMKDLPLIKTRYPMSLAETASTFAETVVADALMASAGSTAEKYQAGWLHSDSAHAFLLNIPVRFQFESGLYDKRLAHKLTPGELNGMMEAAFKDEYGDTLSHANPGFWASKLHFYITGLSFYNFPYTFGYLFSLGVYAQREKLGAGFYGAYKELLRDTAAMTAEELVQKHMKTDIGTASFWEDSIRIVDGHIADFANAVEELT
jgi:oligoendopeptidase F